MGRIKAGKNSCRIIYSMHCNISLLRSKEVFLTRYCPCRQSDLKMEEKNYPIITSSAQSEDRSAASLNQSAERTDAFHFHS